MLGDKNPHITSELNLISNWMRGVGAQLKLLTGAIEASNKQLEASTKTLVGEMEATREQAAATAVAQQEQARAMLKNSRALNLATWALVFATLLLVAVGVWNVARVAEQIELQKTLAASQAREEIRSAPPANLD